ncbi:MAG TPA: RHS repeat-associated core domain-containing protein [Longimicrobium sp.]|nr:RHS repeat-associated core domain-containing protein [Longimicrobium sp.]
MRDASGQMYMRNRYYNPQTGQFTQPDPIGLTGGLNSYGFAAGDPVSYSDPFGLAPCPPDCTLSSLWENVVTVVRRLRDEPEQRELGAKLAPEIVSALASGRMAGRTMAHYPRDFATRRTRNWSAQMASERDARNLARTKIGSNPVQVEPHKLRSADGHWQYRAKPGDVADRHIHLEELNPQTGEVLQNLHLRW